MPQDHLAKPSDQNSCIALQDVSSTSKNNVKRGKLSDNYSESGLSAQFWKNHPHRKDAICREMLTNSWKPLSFYDLETKHQKKFLRHNF